MTINQGIANEISRWFLFVLLFVVLGGGFLSFGLWMLLEGEWIGLLIILYAVFWIYLMAVGFYSLASISLSDEDISFRVFLKTKHYSWDEIVQAGVLWRTIKYSHENVLVLLPKTGIPGDLKTKCICFVISFI